MGADGKSSDAHRMFGLLILICQETRAAHDKGSGGDPDHFRAKSPALQFALEPVYNPFLGQEGHL
jgi:hypothetical protein